MAARIAQEEKFCIICGDSFMAVNTQNKVCHDHQCKLRHKTDLRNKLRWKNGRKKTNTSAYTAYEVSILKDNPFLSSKDLAEIMDYRNWSSISQKRMKLGIKQMSICESCGKEFEKINQHNQCLGCVPSQKEYNEKRKGSITYHYSTYKSNAKKRNIPMDMTLKDFNEYWKKSCTYCGSEINSIGIDRVDSSMGYIKGNMVSCCSTCNEMKMARTKDDWVSHMKKIINHLEDK